jgi:hypothetical protein
MHIHAFFAASSMARKVSGLIFATPAGVNNAGVHRVHLCRALPAALPSHTARGRKRVLEDHTAPRTSVACSAEYNPLMHAKQPRTHGRCNARAGKQHMDVALEQWQADVVEKETTVQGLIQSLRSELQKLPVSHAGL